MMLINIITAICFAALVIEAVFVFMNAILKKRSERIAFLRSFKKGKCAIIYVTAIPLYCIGHMYAGKDFLEALFSAVNKIINLVVLKYETSSISALMEDNSFYRATIWLSFFLVGINAVLFTLSFTSQQLWSFFGWVKRRTTFKDRLIIFGYNSSNIEIYKSDAEKRNKHIVDSLTSQECERLYQEKIYYSSRKSAEKIKQIFSAMKRRNRKHTVIVNTENDEKNIAILRELINRMEEYSDTEREKLFLQLRIIAFGDPKYKTVYDDIVSGGYGCVTYVNKYQKIAMDFIDAYPLSSFMDGRQIDYKTSLVRDGVDINVIMIGFGKTNQQILLTSVANNQFLKGDSDEPSVKAVNYHIFDKKKAENDKNFNHSYYRYKNEFCDGQGNISSKIDKDAYLPLPSLPANEKYSVLDINDKDFYNDIKKITARSALDANFIIIAFGSDLENIDMAQKLIEKREEWELSRLIIFVKSRKIRKQDTMLEEEDCYFIANESDAVYNIDKLLNDGIYNMAQLRNEVYDLEYMLTSNKELTVDEKLMSELHEKAYRAWHKEKSQMERESSLYCCLSLRSKLNLMGLDYVKRDKDESKNTDALSEKEYFEIYAAHDMPNTEEYKGVLADGKKIISYSLDFKKSRRRSLAIHEHQRWNAFMITKGMIPSTKKQILEETATVNGKTKHTNGKNYRVRRHGNLTTFEGLCEFCRMVAERDGCDERDKDVIKYDYQLLDDAYWLLEKTNYKIIKIR